MFKIEVNFYSGMGTNIGMSGNMIMEDNIDHIYIKQYTSWYYKIIMYCIYLYKCPPPPPLNLSNSGIPKNMGLVTKNWKLVGHWLGV